ncbi:MAG: hypothetical protein NTX03_06555 [Bacteroidetes bacterium]|nr:hypothetical protein [Bacteroidota bacterium]
MQVFTQDDVLRFIYNEVDAKEKKSIEDALRLNPSLLTLYTELKEVVAKLGNAKMEPDNSTIDLIMAHSAASKMETSH